MNRGLESLESLKNMPCYDEDGEESEQTIYEVFKEDFDTIEKELKALKIIVKKANIRVLEEFDIYYFKTTNNLYQISKEKYDLLKEVLK